MDSPTPQKVRTLISDIRYRLDELEEATHHIVPEKEWYTRSEFAKKQNIQPKTISNYLSSGRYGKNQRKIGGRWMIHKSQLRKA
jgi:hypothetical protein